MYLDIRYIYMHNKMDVSEKSKRLIIWNGGSMPKPNLVNRKLKMLKWAHPYGHSLPFPL